MVVRNTDKLTLRQLLSLYALYAKMDFAWLTRDRLFASVAIISDIIANAASVTGVFLLAWRFGGIGGMTGDEILLMLAYTTLVTGLFQLFFAANNTGHISRRIGRGQLEHMFIQPLPLPVQLLTEGFIPFTGSGNMLTGAALIAVALWRLDIAPTWWWLFSLAGNLLVSTVIILASSYLASSAAFRAPVQAEEISTYVIDGHGSISEFPLSGMPRKMQTALVAVLPSGLLGWFPTLVLLGKPPLGLPGWFPVAAALAFSAAAAYFFRKGLKYYVTKGINRYLPYGHRR